MIVKKIPNPRKPSTKAARIGGLLDYIEADGEQKVELRFATGDFLSDSRQGQRAEMIALASEAKRSKDPVDHWLLSWKAGEQPTAEHCREAVELLKEHLGLSPAHQTICALHQNTGNLHLHIVLNRTSPDSYSVADNGWSIDRAHRALAEIVKRQGWEQEGRSLHMDSSPEVRKRAEVPSPHTKARDYENATGAKSAERIAIESAAVALKAAASWSDVHAALAAKGMRYEQKGSGALFWVGNTAVKASSVGREFSRKRMAEKFGPFEGQSSHSSPRDMGQPLTPTEAEPAPQWLEYRSLVTSWTAVRGQAQIEQRSAHRRAREEQTTAFRQERKNLYSGVKWGGTELNVARSLLAAEQAKRKADLIERQEHERTALQERFGSRPSYEEFLRSEGNHQLAQKWRYRNSTPLLATISGDGDGREAAHDVRDFIARVEKGQTGTTLFVGYFRTSGRTELSFADRGKRMDVYQTTDRAVVLAALQVASQKWGTLTITGPPEFQMLCAELSKEHGFRIQSLAALQAANRYQSPSFHTSALPNAESAYDLHRRDIQSKLSVKNPSQLDWMIAVRMRVTGHTQESIAGELRKHAEGTRSSEARDWSRYAQRTADAAFGPRGDHEARHLDIRRAHWLTLEHRVDVARAECSSRVPSHLHRSERGSLDR
ncbi:TraI/MobA(P) family conjugative relaxase [Terriglobus sp.]|uniref:TraI/MobA(P) family conjugative relaxase n=1 Tax=Terriglobus sp. TaxID=1889013 RepID=UPI003B000E4C